MRPVDALEKGTGPRGPTNIYTLLRDEDAPKAPWRISDGSGDRWTGDPESWLFELFEPVEVIAPETLQKTAEGLALPSAQSSPTGALEKVESPFDSYEEGTVGIEFVRVDHAPGSSRAAWRCEVVLGFVDKDDAERYAKQGQGQLVAQLKPRCISVTCQVSDEKRDEVRVTAYFG
jgi:hypothetical protein